MQVRSNLHPRSPVSGEPAQLRSISPIIDLRTFDTAGHVYAADQCDAEVSTTDSAFFNTPGETACAQMTAQLRDAARLANADLVRPIHLLAPAAALLHVATGPACLLAAESEQACPQEFCLNFEDGAFTADRASSLTALSKLLGCGLRIGVDARTSWQSTVYGPVRLLIEAVHVSAPMMLSDDDLSDRVARMVELGAAIIVHDARWRDHDALKVLGATHIVNAQADG